jgi:hypothetical protein
MALKTDIDKAQKKREEEKKRQEAFKRFGRPVPWWKCKPGTNKVRILPPWTGEGPNAFQFWCERWIHFSVMAIEAPDEQNQFSVVCPKHTPGAGDILGYGAEESIPCPVCEHVASLRASSDPTDSELAKSIRAKMRVYYNIIDLADPIWTDDAIEEIKQRGCPEDKLPTAGEPKVQVYSSGPTVMQMILDYYADNIDIADLETGHNMVIEREGKGINTDYRVRPDLKASKAPITDEEWEREMWNLDEVMPFLTGEQMDMILGGSSREEVFKLGTATRPALPEGDEETTDESKQLPESTEADANEASQEGSQEDSQSEGGSESTFEIPIDKDGDIDYAKIPHELIESKDSEQLVVKAGTDGEHCVHVPCYGGARQRDTTDENCTGCIVFDRCGERIEQLDEEARLAKEAAAKKKKPGAGKKTPGAGKKTPGAGKKTPGAGKTASGGNGESTKTEPAATAPASDADDLEAQMKAALE